ncbi:MAG: 3-oxoadipate enol-lactonase [Gammaproteobacteria bacterium]|nr:3-oxoadipate enol-lactonase [Gammaproteobacteria bacterium]MBU0787906.1 3-oxoadipate enol-lactonase [Gammaproteobacteria bacterium]MBU0816977.1 3-oxoadipate enol-lactonase [Gammaproteobacteria bacterium]MBU1787141.1 3-oxoadipate enol-lactonase [Gammaproteobacteria bacterium]
MPFATINNIRIHYQLEGDKNAPVLMLCNSLGTTLEMWDPQMSTLLTQFQVLRYDVRGHGQSDVPTGPYTIEQLGMDALALLDHLGLERVDFCGLSMGGMTGMWLGTHHARRIKRLILCNTAAKLGTPELWNARLAVLARDGMAGLTAAVLDRWFTQRFQQRAPHVIEKVRGMLLGTTPQGYEANVIAIREMDQLADIGRIDVPTLVIAGRHDGSTPPELGREIAERISGSRYVELDAAHLSNWEQAGAFSVAVMDFLNQGGMQESARFEAGLLTRRAVLGDAYVDQSLNRRTDFTREFQDIVTRHAWGEIWCRPGLDRHTRSLITIAMLIALNRPDELKLHLRGSLNNGVTQEQLRELLMHSAVYCGVPAALSSFHLATDVLKAAAAEAAT